MVVIDALTRCALLHSVYDLKAEQINGQRCLIGELMLSKFELSHNTEEATKNICCAKSKRAVDHNMVTRQFKKFHSVARTSTIRQG